MWFFILRVSLSKDHLEQTQPTAQSQSKTCNGSFNYLGDSALVWQLPRHVDKGAVPAGGDNEKEDTVYVRVRHRNFT